MDKTILFSAFLNACIIEFSQVGSGMIDGIVISRFLGGAAIASQGIAQPIFSIIGMFSAMFAVGLQIRCAEMLGRGNKTEFVRYFNGVFYCGMLSGFILTAVIMLFSPQLSAILGAGKSSEISSTTSEYLVGVGAGTFSTFAVALLSPAITLDSDKKLVSIGAFIQAVSNIILDIIAVKLNLGLKGVGYATAIATFIYALFLSVHFFRKNRMLKFERTLLKPREYFEVFTLGTGKIFKRFGNVLRPVILNRLIFYYGGTIAVSALAIRNNFSDFAHIPTAGITEAALLVLGIYFGEKNDEMIEAMYSFSGKFGLMIASLVGIVLAAFAKPIASIYVQDNPELRKLVVFAIYMLALYLPVNTFVDLYIAFLQATHKILQMQFFSFATRVVFVSISAFLCGTLFGVYGVLGCFVIGDLLALLFVYIYHAVKNQKILLQPNAFMDLPDDFHLLPQDVISLDVRSTEEAVVVAEQISLFCKGHKLGDKAAYYAGLAFEEIAVNTMQRHSAVRHRADFYIDVRVIITDGVLRLRIKDNGSFFDTGHIFKETKPDAAWDMVSVKLLKAVVKDLQYINYMGTNITLLKFTVK